MDLVYLDYNCFQRGFDDLRQVRIQLEALACQEIFLRAEIGKINLVWSFMHSDETFLCPFPDRKYEAQRLASLCNKRIYPEIKIQKMALVIQKTGKISAKDAIHFACATQANADYFLSCDDQLVRQITKITPKFIVQNPVEYLREALKNEKDEIVG